MQHTLNLTVRENLSAVLASRTYVEAKCAIEQADAAADRLAPAQMTAENAALYRLAENHLATLKVG